MPPVARQVLALQHPVCASAIGLLLFCLGLAGCQQDNKAPFRLGAPKAKLSGRNLMNRVFGKLRRVPGTVHR